MVKFTIELHQWFKDFDYPEEIVRYYSTLDKQKVCEYCGNTMGEHGWIDSTISCPPYDECGQMVCPGDYIFKHKDGTYEIFTEWFLENYLTKIEE